jgi:hypothetical protein
VDRAFSGFLLPLLGLILLPFTTFVFCLVFNPGGGEGANSIWVALGLLLDISSYGSGGYGQRQRSGASAA